MKPYLICLFCIDLSKTPFLQLFVKTKQKKKKKKNTLNGWKWLNKSVFNTLCWSHKNKSYLYTYSL